MRPILITGTGRCGTSAIAGAVHRLGVHFCDHLIPANKGNPAGHYECRQWWQAGERGDNDQYQRLVNSHQQAPVWAIKDTWGYKTLSDQVKALGQDCRLIVMHRGYVAARDSCAKHDRPATADEEMAKRFGGLYSQLATIDNPVLHLNFNDLIERPELTVSQASAFIFAGLDKKPSERQLARAIKSIKPELRHHGRSLRDYRDQETATVIKKLDVEWGVTATPEFAEAFIQFIQEV